MKRLTDTIRLFFMCLVLAGISASARAESKQMRPNMLILAVTPQLSPTVIYKAWAPFLAAMESAVGISLQLRTYDNKAKFDSEVLAGIPDLVYLNPEAVVAAHLSNGYIPLVRDTKMLNGILLVPKDSPIQNVEALRGRTIAFPWETAFAASTYLRMQLRDKIKIEFTPVYAGNHQNVFRQLLLGEADAGGTVPNILAKEPEAVRARLRTIYTTPNLAPHAIAAHPRVPANLVEQLRQAIIQQAQKTDGKAMLEAISIPNPVIADYKRDYAPLEKLHRELNTQPASSVK